MATDAPIKVWRRAGSPPVTWRFRDGQGNPVPLPDSFSLTIDSPTRSAVIEVANGDPSLVLDRVAGTVSWNYGPNDSVRVPAGSGSTYELMGYTAGVPRLWAGGTVTGEGWRR